MAPGFRSKSAIAGLHHVMAVTCAGREEEGLGLLRVLLLGLQTAVEHAEEDAEDANCYNDAHCCSWAHQDV
jgi:hypothetical protein